MKAENLQKLKELKKNIRLAAVSYLKSKNIEIKADDSMDMEDEEDMCPGCEDLKMEQDYMYSMMNNMYSYLNYLESSLYSYASEHQNGHLPPILGAEKMNAALKSLGIDKDYEIRKPVIYASEMVENGDTLNISIKKTK
jgi:hypothetical protein